MKTINLLVSLRESDNGGVASIHKFATPEDEKNALEMETGGVRQIASAMFQEAMIRELYLDVLMKLQDNPLFIENYKAASPNEQRVMEKILGEQAHKIVTRNSLVMSEPAARTVLAMLSQGGQSGTSDV
jgi:hypothetical protein